MNKINLYQMILTTSLMMIILTFSLKFLHPIIMNIMIIIYSIFLSVLMSSWSYNFILSFMLTLMMISGLLIIFLYFTSLIANEKNKKIHWQLFLILMLMSNFIWMIMNYSLHMMPLMLKSKENLNLIYINKSMFNNIQKIYHYPFSNMTIMTMIYLLLTLFLIIKTCSYKSSSLRKIS